MKLLGPAASAAIAPGVQWWVCRCGRKLYEHGARTVPNTGGREYVCGALKSGRFEPTDARLDFGCDVGVGWKR